MTGRNRTIFVVVGLWLVSVHVPSSGNAAPANGSETPKVPKGTTSTRVPGLAVWVEPTVPEGERIGGWVEERGAEVLRQHEPPLEPQDLVRVAVRGGPFDYQIYVALLRDRRLLPDQPDVLVCECGSDEMLERVGEAIAAGARRLTDAAAAEREAEAEAKAREEVEPVVVEDAGKKRKRLGVLGYAGIGVSVLGAGVLGGGIALALREEEIRGDPGQIETRAMRGPGIGLAVGGGVALAAGVSLLVVDLVRQRKRAMAVVPSWGPGQLGVAIAWQGAGRVRR